MRGIRIGRVFRGRLNLRVTLVLILLLVVGVCAWLLIREQRMDAGSPNAIDVYMGDMLAGRIDAEWLEHLETQELELLGSRFLCVSLREALNSVGARPTSHESVRLENETQELTISADAILSRENAYIFYQINGKPITKKQGGPYQVIVFLEDGGFSSLGGVKEITIEFE